MSFMMAVLGGMLAGPPLACVAQPSPPNWPVRPVRVIVPFPAGGAADLSGRLLAQRIGESLRQPFIVDNRPGANGAIGTELVAKAPADGYTLLIVDRSALGINPSLFLKLGYDPRKDFAYIGIAAEAPYVLVTSPALPVRSVAELIALARGTPGTLRYASFGNGSLPQLNLEAFNQRNGTDLLHVPYKGAPQAVQAVLAGEVSVALVTAPSALGFIREGRLRALAVGADSRLALLPEVSTIAEAGAAPGTLIPSYFALAAPARTPAPIVALLGSELQRTVNAPDIAEKLRAAGLVPAWSTPEAMAASVVRDIEYFRKLTAAIGLKPE